MMYGVYPIYISGADRDRWGEMPVPQCDFEFEATSDTVATFERMAERYRNSRNDQVVVVSSPRPAGVETTILVYHGRVATWLLYFVRSGLFEGDMRPGRDLPLEPPPYDPCLDIEYVYRTQASVLKWADA